MPVLSELEKMRMQKAALDLIDALMKDESLLKTEGIFRRSVSQKHLTAATSHIKQGGTCDWFDWEQGGSQALFRASVLKKMIKELFFDQQKVTTSSSPDPNIDPAKQVDTILNLVAGDDGLQKMIVIRLARLMFKTDEMQKSSTTGNKMSLNSIVTLITPNLLGKSLTVGVEFTVHQKQLKQDIDNIEFLAQHIGKIASNAEEDRKLLQALEKRLKPSSEQYCTAYKDIRSRAIDTLLATMKSTTFPVQRFLFFRGGESRIIDRVPVRLPKHLALMHDAIVQGRDRGKSDTKIFAAIQEIAGDALNKQSKGRALATTEIYEHIQKGPEVVVVAQNSHTAAPSVDPAPNVSDDNDPAPF